MIHKDCLEYAECLVEIARCKRLLAVNKKHLRGQWRQDAAALDELSLDRGTMDVLDGDAVAAKRDEVLRESGLDGQVFDWFIDYKEEALKAFVSIIETDKSGSQ
jgi:hypothetical protein